MSIKQNITSLQNLLEQVNNLPEVGGVELPILTNEGIADDLVTGKELIDSEGNIVTGTNPYEKVATDTEVNTQADLIAQIVDALDGKAAGIELPTLTNEGSASDLLSGKQLINGDGNKVTGTFSIDSELTTQDTLIAELQSVLDGKAGGSESSFETVIGTVGASGPVIGDTVTGTVYYIDGNGAYATSNILGTITVMKDSIIVGYSGDGVRASGGVNQIGETTGSVKTYHVIDDFEIRI